MFIIELLKLKVCLASDITMHVTYEGAPAQGATVTRVVKFNGKEYTTETQTDKDGKFTLPILEEIYIWNAFKSVVSIDQKITITYKNESHLALELTKESFDYDGELNNLSAVERGYSKFLSYEFSCELTNKKPDRFRAIKGTGANFGGKCLHISEIDPKLAN